MRKIFSDMTTLLSDTKRKGGLHPSVKNRTAY